jgi:chemotaxis protein MotB
VGVGGMTFRWQQAHAEPRHADDWLITYADMITLLLCFFVFFLIVSLKKDQVKPLASPPIQQAFELKEDVKTPKQLPDVFENKAEFRRIEEFEAATALEQEVPAPEPVLAPPPPEPQPQVQREGDRIATIEISSAAFFDQGSAALAAEGKALLVAVAQDLKAEQYKDYRITVEGHTDDTPITTPQFPSNWELSTARASAVVHFFLDRGIPAEKLRAAGYANTFPKLPNRDALGIPIPENQAQNRRVVIKLEKIEKAD